MSGMEKERIRIGGLVKQSLVDWDGVLSAVVFTKGCNFRCGYCHNPALVVPALMRERPDVAASEVFDYLARRRGFCIEQCLFCKKTVRAVVVYAKVNFVTV